MRTALSIVVIVLSIAALSAGYFSGSSSVHPAIHSVVRAVPVVEMPAPAVFARSLHGAHSLEQMDDVASSTDGDAVVSNDPAQGSLGSDAVVALVIAGAGRSLRLESPFLDLPVPVAVIVDPEADEAQAVAAAAFERGKTVYLRLDLTASHAVLERRLAAYAKAFPAAGGVAVDFDPADAPRQAQELTKLLAHRGIGVLDMSGAGAGARLLLSRAGIHVRRRDVTIDNRDERGYVQFMLAQAVTVARGRGTAVVVAHPRPQSFAALSGLIGEHAREGVNFTGL